MGLCGFTDRFFQTLKDGTTLTQSLPETERKILNSFKNTLIPTFEEKQHKENFKAYLLTSRGLGTELLNIR